MTDMDVLYVSEESKQKIAEIRSSPTSLSFGKYRIQIEPGLLRYFLYVWKEREVKPTFNIVIDRSINKTFIKNKDGTMSELVNSADFFWDAFVTTPTKPAKLPQTVTEKYLDEVEVNYDEWLAS